MSLPQEDLDRCLMECCIGLDFKNICQRIGIPANENITVEIMDSKNTPLTKIDFETGPEVLANPQNKDARQEIINFLNKCDVHFKLFDLLPISCTESDELQSNKEVYKFNVNYGKLQSVDPRADFDPVANSLSLGSINVILIKIWPWSRPRRCCIF